MIVDYVGGVKRVQIKAKSKCCDSWVNSRVGFNFYVKSNSDQLVGR